MTRHECKTYFRVLFDFDRKANAAFLRENREPTPEDLGIFRKDEAERYILDTFGVTPVWEFHSFILGYNETYDVDVNKMIRKTLCGLMGKEEQIRAMRRRFGVDTVLEVVPYLLSDSPDPNPCLSLENDIIAFLYKSGTEYDIDYYVF